MAKHVGRRTAKKINRGRGKQGRKKKPEAPKDNTPADVKKSAPRPLNAELRAAFKEDPSSLSADDRARAEQLLARDARKAAKKAARRVSSETPSPGTA